MIDALGLTAEQQEQLKQLRESHRAELETFREKIAAGEVDRDAIRESMEARRDEMQDLLGEVLTEKQQEIVALHRAVMVELRGAHKIQRGRRSGR